MKKNINIFLYVMILLITVYIIFNLLDLTSKPVINLITKNEETEEIKYISVYSNKKVKKIEAFKSDDFQIFTADSSDFSSSISENKIINNLNNTFVIDSKGNIINNDVIITEILSEAVKIDHSILLLQIIKLYDDYFVLVRLNVNWQSPNEFYEYDKKEKTLKKLMTLQGDYVIGISSVIKE